MSRHQKSPAVLLNEETNSQECRRLLSKIDKMREILRSEKISLPHIVVVGDQSVGKSSILEAISGVELPRAQQICTRCPLELRLKTCPPETNEHAVIRCEGVQEMIINNLSRIAAEITKLTNILTGNSVNISKLPIFLTIFKREITEDLTLIDLPGITRTQLEGQAPTIYHDIVSLIEECVKHARAIVVHVIPSSEDFTRSESIQICQKYDPNFERQIIAVSKIDKYDVGIGEKLQGIGHGSIPNILGSVAVLNRKQEEIDERVSFEEMSKREEAFFRNTPAFRDVPKENLGRRALVKKLVSIQQELIKTAMPEIITDVQKKLAEAKREYDQLPMPVRLENEAQIIFFGIIRNYRTSLETRCRGEYNILIETNSNVFNPADLSKWDDRIAYHLKKIGDFTAQRINKIFTDLTNIGQGNMIKQATEENYGGGLPNFPSTNIIQQLYAPYHKKLHEPCEEMIAWFAEYTKACLAFVLGTQINDNVPYKNQLTKEINKVTQLIIEKSKSKCMESVELLLKIEEKVFTVNNHYTILFENMRDDLLSKKQQVHDITIGLRAYCSIVKARIIDQLFQLCEFWFIRNGVLVVDQVLNESISSKEIFKWMKESKSSEHRRAALQNTIQAMEAALVEALAE